MSEPALQGSLLRSAEFRRTREPAWRELEALMNKIERQGIAAADPGELERLPLLYRSTLSSLAVARSIALDRNLLAYLENLALRAYLAVYRPRANLLEGFATFLRHGFPNAVRAARWHILMSFITFVSGTLVGAILTRSDESWFSAFVPTGLAGGRGMSSTHDSLLHDELFHPWPGFVESFIVFANYLFQNNTTVALLAFGLGVVGGIPTLLLIAYQGLILGAMFALHANRGLSVEFLGWVSIHGVTEIAAILLAGAAGLMVAEKVLLPGRHGRLENIAISGHQAAQVMAGAAMMLFIAGLIEGGLRQAVASTEWRFVFAGVTFILWSAYFVFAGRK